MTTHARYRLIIFNLEKSANVGMLIRSAYAFGCDEVLIVGRKHMRNTGSGGAMTNQKRRHFYRMADAISYCREDGFRILGIEIGGLPMTQADLSKDTAFVLGNEGRGLAEAHRFCDGIVTVPQWGGLPSLNVAVAGSLVMFEFQRRLDLPFAQVEGERYHDHIFKLDQPPQSENAGDAPPNQPAPQAPPD